jgi:hypothetical protein
VIWFAFMSLLSNRLLPHLLGKKRKVTKAVAKAVASLLGINSVHSLAQEISKLAA